MKISVLVSIARQVEGEWIFTNIVKAHVDSNNLKEYLNTTDLPKTGVFEGVECIIEYGIFKDIEVEGIVTAEAITDLPNQY